ncbi:NFACT RNA binding domain-containing protein [uncultured Treponema sp.]|uniref:NFACT RNA binding domain-containing protein n=1 Tax=uncultured Treponema sp. TaxID=162155 RepID=UPI002588A849|nr:NFACT RNA binding domain-containing protein [uncultured Treponema sp.]
MSLNCNEINTILSELDLPGSFIQEIVQPGFDTLAFRIVNKGSVSTIIICTAPQACRINETRTRIPKNEKPLRFNEFLKSHIQGMRINSCRQIALDRIIKMDVSTWKERFFIYIRLWSGAANVIVTDEAGIIQDCMFRRPKKGEVTGGTFEIQEREATAEEKKEALQKFPVRTFDEITAEYSGENAATHSAAGSAKKEQPLTFNRKVDIFYSEHAHILSRETLLAQAQKWYNVKHSKMEAALQRLLEKQNNFSDAAKLKHTGDLILSFGQDAKGGMLDCTDYDTGLEVHIKIDPSKSVQENAAVYYEQYKKAVSGQDALAHDIDMAKKTIAALDAQYNAMLNEKNVIKIEQMLRKDTKPKQKTEKPHAGLHYEIDGWTIIVGRTAAENDELLRHTVKGQDMWLHARDYAGGYVFIRARRDKTVPLDILLYAGNLAVYHSKARRNGQADLYYTQVKYLRRAKNGPKGLVLPTQEKNLLVKIDEQRLRKLDELEKSAQSI